jgi:hypothetical protein
VNGTRDYGTLTDELGLVMTTHGAVMVVAGLGFGYAVLRARTFPAWTAVALMAGVVLVALTRTMSQEVQPVATGVRDLGFAGIGAALLDHRPCGVDSQLRADGPRVRFDARSRRCGAGG